MNDMPQEATGKGAPELLSINEIATRFKVSRQTVHTLRRRGLFPEPSPTPGSTRLKWDSAILAAYFEANPPQPGKKLERRIKPGAAPEPPAE